MYKFEVSGLKVVQSWLRYRMKKGAGKQSSPLDDIRPAVWPTAFTVELLELLWTLEATVTEYPEQAELLYAVADGDCFNAVSCCPFRRECENRPSLRRPGADWCKSKRLAPSCILCLNSNRSGACPNGDKD